MIIFVVPAFNEEQNVGLLLEQTRAKMEAIHQNYHVVIVDDGSMDRTREIAYSYAPTIPVEVVSHPVNRGVGAVFRTGFGRALALAKTGDIIVTKEADNTSDLSILETMLAKIEAGNDVVLASCFAPEGKVVGSTWDRHLLSFGANFLLRTFFPIRGVRTYSSFYRAYRAQTLQQAFAAYDGKLLESQGFACMVEMLVKLNRLPIRIVEVPMILQCKMRKGASKMVRVKTIQEYIRLIIREAFRSKDLERRAIAAFTALRSA